MLYSCQCQHFIVLIAELFVQSNYVFISNAKIHLFVIANDEFGIFFFLNIYIYVAVLLTRNLCNASIDFVFILFYSKICGKEFCIVAAIVKVFMHLVKLIK